MKPLLQVSGLEKRYPSVVALRNFNCRVPPGGAFALLGRNGAGKTTALECIAGVREPDAGGVRINGLDARRHPCEVRRSLGVVLQGSAFPEQLTVREVVQLHASFHERPAPLSEVLAGFGLTVLAGTRVGRLSGGQQKRLALGVAMIHRPRVLLLDEPGAALDIEGRICLHRAIREVRAAGGAVVMATHDLVEIEALCDQVGILDAGELLAQGAPSELIAGIAKEKLISVRTDRAVDVTSLAGRLGIAEPWIEREALCFTTLDPMSLVEALTEALREQGATLVELQVRQPSLVDVLNRLTADSRKQGGVAE